MLSRLFFLTTFLTTTIAFCQKKTITHNDYDLWKQVANTKISDQGNLIVSTIELVTKRGDGHVQVYSGKTGKKFTFARGYDTSITADENYVVFKRKPAYDTVRKEKKDEVKKDDQAKDDLFIYDVKNNTIYDSILRVKSYKLPKKHEGWLVIQKFKDKKKKKDDKDKKAKDSIPQEKKDTSKQKVSLAFKQDYALVYQFKNKKKDTIHQIKDFVLPEKGTSFIYTLKNEKKKEKDIGVYRYDVSNNTKTVIDTVQYLYSQLAIDNVANQFAYISSPDSTHVDSLKHELRFSRNGILNKLVDTLGTNLKKGWVLSKDQAPFFSKSGKRLYFSSKPVVHFNRDTTMLDDEIPEVDVWNWQDKILQPEQKSRSESLSKKAFLSYYDTNSNIYVQIQDEDIDNLIFDRKKEQKHILGSTGKPYDLSRSWAWPWTRDYYIINTLTGQKTPGIKKAALNPAISPDGKYAVYFDIQAQHWFSLNLETAQQKNLTEGLPVAFHDEDDDHPALPYPHGFGGFDKDGAALVYDKFDIWRLMPNGNGKPVNITRDGRKRNIEYRVKRLDLENRNLASYIDKKLLVTSFDKTTKASGLYTWHKGKLNEKISPSSYFIGRYQKAGDAEVFTFTKENFQVYPDLRLTKNGFKSSLKITDLNPHEKDFKWGTVEQFSWRAYDGTKLDGLIYKPEDFDPSGKYPLMTYFYEKRSDSYRRHYTPSPSRSIVNPTYLVSNDYVMFIPDIVYKDGKPGPSAYNCVVSGVEAVEELGYIDSGNMAIQGQSWGGYQVAYLVTVTNKFKAAMAGAPVSNMTSAYGGIRWGSGLSRAFQYERSQSRLGKDLWEGFDLYIENSPLFSIPKIETPLLMMHNDEDGAVPYYQGIEMFMGMRRLQKPAWLLVYNKEAHNLTKIKNRQDLSIRMMQFFDHYLKDEPAPVWMTKGLPRVNKGKDLGYELDED